MWWCDAQHYSLSVSAVVEHTHKSVQTDCFWYQIQLSDRMSLSMHCKLQAALARQVQTHALWATALTSIAGLTLALNVDENSSHFNVQFICSGTLLKAALKCWLNITSFSRSVQFKWNTFQQKVSSGWGHFWSILSAKTSRTQTVYVF